MEAMSPTVLVSMLSKVTKPNTTKMFLKLHHPNALKALQSVDYSKFYKNTAYTPALSLQEINYLLNERILGNPHLLEKVD